MESTEKLVTLVTHYLPTEGENYQELADLNIVNRDEYCSRHGYVHHVHKGTYGDPSLYYAYQRLKLVLDLMESENSTKFYWVLNVSSIIMNMRESVVDIIQAHIWPYDFWISKDVHGINAGSMIFRNTEWSKQWLRFLISLEPRYRNDSWHEQRAIMDHWIHEDWTHKICLVPQNLINSYLYQFYPPWNTGTAGNMMPGDLVLSLPGLTLKQRIDITKNPSVQEAILK